MDALAAALDGVRFGGLEQAGTVPAAPVRGVDPEALDVEPPPRDAGDDAANDRALVVPSASGSRSTCRRRGWRARPSARCWSGARWPLGTLEEPPRHTAGTSVGARARDAWRELRTVLATHGGRIGLLLAVLPIGTGAAQFLFGSLGPEWHVSADVVP